MSGSDYSVDDSSSDDLNFSDCKIDKPENQTGQSQTFHDILQTPKASEKKMFKPRKKAINYRAQKVLVSLFAQEKNIKVEPKEKVKEKKIVSKKVKTLTKIRNEQPSTSGISSYLKNVQKESWYCHLCKTDRVSDMRLCNQCSRYVHEECEGLTKHDKIQFFQCSYCLDIDN